MSIQKALKANSEFEVIVINKMDSTLDFKTVSVIRYVDDIALINKGLNEDTPICLTNLDIMYTGMKVQLK